MLRLAYDAIYSHPLPNNHRFPMVKYELIPAQLLHEGLISHENIFAPSGMCSEEVILWSHDANYWHQLRDLTLPLKDIRRTGFPLSALLVERERRIAQGTIDGCHEALKYGVAFNVAGGTHHAGSNWGEGFCLLNDHVISANYMLNNKLASSILIIDLDVHQGNGTAQMCQNNPHIYTFSVHGHNNFPYRKEVSDKDIALPDGVGDDEYLRMLGDELSFVFEAAKPDFVFYQAGVDVLATDKLGKLGMSRAGCAERDRMVLQTCFDKKIPMQISMGGGYSAQIADIVEAHCNTYRLADRIFF